MRGTETNNKIRIINIITAAMIAAVLLVSIGNSFYTYMSTDFNQYDNHIRLQLQKQKNEIENGQFKKGRYPYLVFDLTGKVIYSQLPGIAKEGAVVNVQEVLQYDKSFASKYKNKSKECFVVKENGAVNEFVVFLVPKSEVNHNTNKNEGVFIYLPLMIGIMISIAITAYRTFYCNRRILKPLKEISTSAKGIIAGNYDLEVLRTYWKKVNGNEVGDLSYAFELMRDELKEKQIREEALKKSQQELISCISHDLKTPISTIKAYSEGIRDNIAKSEERKLEYIHIIINKTNLLIDMINELLEYSNAQLKQLNIKREEIYFLDFFNPLMKEIEIFVRQNRMEFIYEPKLPELLVTIDRKRITEVIYNLVENSIKYCGKNGNICITAEREDKFVLIKVKDNGIGISADDIPYVFDKFFRAEKSRSTSIPGSGLGLSICKYIVNEHGGEIYCKSSAKNGCEIGFTIQ